MPLLSRLLVPVKRLLVILGNLKTPVIATGQVVLKVRVSALGQARHLIDGGRVRRFRRKLFYILGVLAVFFSGNGINLNRLFSLPQNEILYFVKRG